MTNYRLYLLRDGHFARYEVIRCETDQVALIWADDLRHGEAAELWCGPRLVRKFDEGAERG